MFSLSRSMHSCRLLSASACVVVERRVASRPSPLKRPDDVATILRMPVEAALPKRADALATPLLVMDRSATSRAVVVVVFTVLAGELLLIRKLFPKFRSLNFGYCASYLRILRNLNVKYDTQVTCCLQAFQWRIPMPSASTTTYCPTTTRSSGPWSTTATCSPCALSSNSRSSSIW